MTTAEKVRVGDVLELKRREVAIDFSTQYEEIGVRSFGKGIFHKEPVGGASLGSKRVFRIEPGDLVMSNVFAWEGAIAVATQAEFGKIGSHRFMTFVPRDGRIDIAWASWFFLSEPGLALINRASPGSAGRNRTLAVKRFEDLVIPRPTIAEQRRVVARIDRASDLAAAVASHVERAGEVAWATQAALASGVGLHEAERAEIPLSEVVSPSVAQVTVDPTAEYRLSGIYSFGRGLINRGVIMGSETSYKTLTRLEFDNIVFSKLNGWEGAVAVVGEASDGSYVSGEYPSFTVDESQLLPGFFRGVAKSAAFWDKLNRSVRGSMVRRRRISASDFLRATIWLPSLHEQARIATLIDNLEETLGRSQRSHSRATAIRGAILNQEFAAPT